MIIAFDIDETITEEHSFLLKHAPEFLKEKFHDGFTMINPDGYGVSEVYNLKDYLVTHAIAESHEVEELCKKIDNEFWTKHFVKYMFYPIKKEVCQTLWALKKHHMKIYFISTRGKATSGQISGKSLFIQKRVVPFLTRLQLWYNHLPYDGLFLVEDNQQKAEMIEQLNADIAFDDNLDLIRLLCLKNRKVVCINSQVNIQQKSNQEDFSRINFNYKEVTEAVNLLLIYERIDKKKIKKLTQNHIRRTESFYKLLRMCWSEKVIQKYNPLIIGLDNIPKEPEACVYIADHRNIKDPLIVTAVLPHPVHFAALKRMFENRENLFGLVGKNWGTYLTTVVVKCIGAIPVARPGDFDYNQTNFQMMSYIGDYLENRSSVLIFPEGTLNRTPNQNGDILPLKSIYAFKICEKGKAIVCPVAITWLPADARAKHKVIIAFLKPIITEGLGKKELFEIWSTNIQNALGRMKQIEECLVKEIPSPDLVLTEQINSLMDDILNI